MSLLDAALLTALRSAPVHLPCGELAGILHVRPAEVAGAVAGLRDAGFEIEEHPALGFRLLSAPDRIIADDLRSRTGTLHALREIIVFEETDSTNQRAIDLGQSGMRGGVVIFAERQTRGRGRFGRRWESAAHCGLWFSLLIRPELPLIRWSRLTTWTAVIIADVLEAEAGLEVGIKWPNDLEHRGRKLGGILIESLPDKEGRHFAVIGIGLNINHTQEDFPGELQGRAGSIRIARRGEIQDRPALAAAILRGLDSRLGELQDPVFQTVIASAAKRSTLLGTRIALENAGHRVIGLAESLAEDGRLLVRMDDGSVELVGAGEATVLRS